MNPNFLDFEQPIADLQAKIEELRLVGNDNSLNIGDEISRLQDKSKTLTEDIFGKLTSWQIARLARHPRRPYTLDYIQHIFTEFDSSMATATSPTTRPSSAVSLAWKTSR